MSIDLLFRRRMMVPKSSGSVVAVKKGSVVLDENAANFTITHDLNAENYMLLVRRKTPLIREGCCNAVFVVGKALPEKYSFKHLGDEHVAAMTIESRTTADYYIGYPGNYSTLVSNFGLNSTTVYARGDAYPFVAGEYEWVAINLDADADAQDAATISSDTSSKTITDDLGTTDKVGVLYADTATIGENCWNASFVFGDYFKAAMGGSKEAIFGFEARSTWASATDIVEGAPTSASMSTNTTTFVTRAGTYKLLAGDYHYKIYKL